MELMISVCLKLWPKFIISVMISEALNEALNEWISVGISVIAENKNLSVPEITSFMLKLLLSVKKLRFQQHLNFCFQQLLKCPLKSIHSELHSELLKSLLK